MNEANESLVINLIGALKPKFSSDKGFYCFFYGGLTGVGETPYGAALDFYNCFMGRSCNASILKPVEELCFSVRTRNCLKNANISTIFDLITMNEDDLCRTRH